MESKAKDHISVCVCTFRRGELLRRLLQKLQSLEPQGLFEYSVVVVDNDAEHSAEAVVRDVAAGSKIPIQYYAESERSISLARNRSIREAKGNLIAFIDDDEFPDVNWLATLRNCLYETAADGVLGPVLPHFDNKPPGWLVKSGLLDRERFATGSVLQDSRYMRTGNALVRRSMFKEGEVWFDPLYGLSGGGDAVFFKGMVAAGHKLVWCDEALVYETVPIERQTRAYHIRRAFTRGMTCAWAFPFFSMDTAKSCAAVVIYTLALPIFWLRGEHCLMRYFVKTCDHFSKLLAYMGIVVVQKRPY